MMPYTIRYDDDIHRKLKIIAAYKNKSLNALMLEAFNGIIRDWEKEHGSIELPE